MGARPTGERWTCQARRWLGVADAVRRVSYTMPLNEGSQIQFYQRPSACYIWAVVPPIGAHACNRLRPARSWLPRSVSAPGNDPGLERRRRRAGADPPRAVFSGSTRCSSQRSASVSPPSWADFLYRAHVTNTPRLGGSRTKSYACRSHKNDQLFLLYLGALRRRHGASSWRCGARRDPPH